jgi:FG-GAP-like repeat
MSKFMGVQIGLLFAALTCTLTIPAFAAGVSYTEHISSGQATYLHADLNNDGREDFVYTLGQTTGGFAVVLSTGDGTYAKPVTYTLPYGEDAFAIGIGDFNSDQKADLVVFAAGSDTQQYDLFLYLNDGKGTFTEKRSFPLDTEVTDVVVGDFNHDRMMDIAFIADSELNVWFGDGDSGFTPGPTTPVNEAGNIMLGDFDGDGIADIAIGDVVNFDSFEVLFGDGTGAFPSETTIHVPGGHSLFGAADVNGDGKMDIVASTFYPNSPDHIDVYYGDADRTFASHTTILTKHCASNTATPLAEDVNGDGIKDLIVPESDCGVEGQATQYVGVLTRNADSSYNPDQIVYQSSSPSLILSWLSAVRGNADTKPDIAFSQCTATPCALQANYDTEALLNTTSGNFHTCNAPDAFEGINVCSPIAGSTVASSVPFRVGAAGQVIMRKIELWIDGKKMVQQLNGFSNYSFLDATLKLSQGSHQVDIYAAGWDNSLQEKSFTLYVR